MSVRERCKKESEADRERERERERDTKKGREKQREVVRNIQSGIGYERIVFFDRSIHTYRSLPNLE